MLGAGLLAVGLLALAGCTAQPGSSRPSPTSSPSRLSSSPASTSSPSASLSSPASPADPVDPVEYAKQIVRATNDVRRARGLAELRGSKCAQSAARGRVLDLIGKAKLTHAPLAGVITGCAPATTAAENLSRAAASPAAVVDAWMNSPGHRSNLLDPALTEIGVGCVRSDKSMLCSQVFLGP